MVLTFFQILFIKVRDLLEKNEKKNRKTNRNILSLGTEKIESNKRFW